MMRRAHALSLALLGLACTVDSGDTSAGFTAGDTAPTTDPTATASASDSDTDGGTGGTSTSSTSSGSGTSSTSGDPTGTSSSSTTGTSSTSSTTGGGGGCGNGVAEMGEECDGNDFGGLTCADFMSGNDPFDGGTLTCTVNCTVITSDCTLCGDGAATGTETCDGADLAGATCVTEGFDGGTVTCNASCDGLDTTACTTCGDGTVDAGETCDSGVGGETCVSQGFDGGTLACGNDCAYDTSQCYACGDNVASGPEDCDGNDLGGNACTDLPAPQNGNFTGGTLTCDNVCAYDTSGCTYCGDGIKNGTEDCDGVDLGTAMCSDLGYLGGGTLACNADCSLDEASCVGPICGVADAGQGTCPAQCTNCNNGVCTIVCNGNVFDEGPCIDAVLDCPAGWPCHVDCNSYGCQGTTLNCADGVCTVDCDGISACAGMDVNCDLQSCSATCDIFTSPTMNCGNSCDCQGC